MFTDAFRFKAIQYLSIIGNSYEIICIASSLFSESNILSSPTSVILLIDLLRYGCWTKGEKDKEFLT